MGFSLVVLPEVLAVCRLPAGVGLPPWTAVLPSGSFCSVTWTADEVSIVCPQAIVPPEVQAERGWQGFKVEGPLDFGLTGVLAQIAAPLAEAQISIFALSTFDTDTILVKTEKLAQAVAALTAVGHTITLLP